MQQLEDVRYAGEVMYEELEAYTEDFEAREQQLAGEMQKALKEQEAVVGGTL
jgi:hypothetical protein